MLPLCASFVAVSRRPPSCFCLPLFHKSQDCDCGLDHGCCDTENDSWIHVPAPPFLLMRPIPRMDPLTLKYKVIMRGYDCSGMLCRQMLEIHPCWTIAPQRTSRRMAYANPEGISHRELACWVGEGFAWESRHATAAFFATRFNVLYIAPIPRAADKINNIAPTISCKVFRVTFRSSRTPMKDPNQAHSIPAMIKPLSPCLPTVVKC